MRKTFFMKSMAMLAIVVSAVSCSSDEDMYDPNAAQNQLKAQYEAEFIRQFGNIAPGHTWGFSDQTPTEQGVRGFDATANMWGGYVEVPAPLTEEQIKVVTDWFAANPNPQGVAVNWSDFFAQQVSSTDYGRQMNKLTCGDNDEHINDFNSGDRSAKNVWGGELYNQNDPNARVYYSDKISFMTGSSTSRFGYHNSFESNTYHRYVIIPGDMIDPIVAGRYFVGFDYEAHGQAANQQVEADGFYNDWVICITPGLYKDGQRIIAEDFGEIGDFDFNDVVFDVRFAWDGATITVRAAGGRLPLKIGGVEIHEALGIGTDVMANTGKDTKTCPVAIFRVQGDFGWNANNIPVVVTKDGADITLTTEAGKAPAKICVPLTYRWTIEKTNIKAAYPDFSDYVANPGRTTWCTNPVAGTVF